MNSHEVFIHIHQGCFTGTGAIVRLPQCQWSKPDGYGEISQCITTTKHSKAKTVCIFLGIYCIKSRHGAVVTHAGTRYNLNVFEVRCKLLFLNISLCNIYVIDDIIRIRFQWQGQWNVDAFRLIYLKKYIYIYNGNIDIYILYLNEYYWYRRNVIICSPV